MCDYVGVNEVGKSLGRDGKYFGTAFLYYIGVLGFGWSTSKK